jgi:hypothetical protein
VRRKISSGKRSQDMLQKRSNGANTIFRFGLELLLGVGLELLKRYSKSWVDSVRTGGRIRRQVPEIREAPDAPVQSS